jgi:hypothetical protein
MIYIDPPTWPGRAGRRSAGRLWAHLISDESYDELHEFAATLGIPRRGFERDHYDVPESLVDTAIGLGATLVSSREIIAKLNAAGLRRPQRRGPAR